MTRDRAVLAPADTPLAGPRQATDRLKALAVAPYCSMCRVVFAVMKWVRVQAGIGCAASARDSAAKGSGLGQRAPQALFSPAAAAH